MTRNIGDVVKLEPFDIAYSKVSQKYKDSDIGGKNIWNLTKDLWDDFATQPVLKLRESNNTGDIWRVSAFDKYSIYVCSWWIPTELLRSSATISKKTANKLYNYFKIKI